jgi:hypothetical protein
MIPNDDELAKLNRKELTDLFNANNPPKPVKAPFRTKATALARVKALRDGTTKVKTPKAPKTPKPKTPKAAKPVGPGRIRKPFNLPARKEIKEARKDSKRAGLVELLGTPAGATVEEVMAKWDWTRREALEGVRLVHKLLGYGLRESGEGRIHLVRS